MARAVLPSTAGAACDIGSGALPRGPGSSRLTTPMARIVVAGASPCTRRPMIVSGVSSTVGLPETTPLTIRRAARSAEMLSPGSDASGANQA